MKKVSKKNAKISLGRFCYKDSKTGDNKVCLGFILDGNNEPELSSAIHCSNQSCYQAFIDYCKNIDNEKITCDNTDVFTEFIGYSGHIETFNVKDIRFYPEDEVVYGYWVSNIYDKKGKKFPDVYYVTVDDYNSFNDLLDDIDYGDKYGIDVYKLKKCQLVKTVCKISDFEYKFL